MNLHCKRDQYNYKSGRYGYKLSAGLIQLVLENGCKYLGISGTIYGHLMPTKTMKLNHLVISNVFSVNTLDVILASCYSLEKLSLNNVHLSYSMISSICNQNAKTLKVLNLQGCSREDEGEEQSHFDDMPQIIKVVYIWSSLLQLTVESCDLSQAEKESGKLGHTGAICWLKK